jgi:peptide-methionine (S)-S-oxide reductase
VESGYAGVQYRTRRTKPCTGKTGHAEVVQITFDPDAISFNDLLHVFFTIHDPTTMNQQGGDVGTQYRSAVYYHSPAQKTETERVIRELTAEKVWTIRSSPRQAVETFYPAEEYHRDYYRRNPNQGTAAPSSRPKSPRCARRTSIDSNNRRIRARWSSTQRQTRRRGVRPIPNHSERPRGRARGRRLYSVPRGAPHSAAVVGDEDVVSLTRLAADPRGFRGSSARSAVPSLMDCGTARCRGCFRRREVSMEMNVQEIERKTPPRGVPPGPVHRTKPSAA